MTHAIQQTENFAKWLASVPDLRTGIAIARRIEGHQPITVALAKKHSAYWQ